MQLHPKYVTNDNGEPTAVLLPLEEYRLVIEAIEDQLDATDLDEAVAQDSEFVPYDQLQGRLRDEEKL